MRGQGPERGPGPADSNRSTGPGRPPASDGRNLAFHVPLTHYLRYLAKAGRVPLAFPRSTADLLAHRWERLEPLKAELSHRYAAGPPSEVRCDGFRIQLDPEDTAFVSPSIAVFGWHELGTSELVDRLVRPGATVVDVGAGLGWFTLLAGARAGPRGHIVALEPESRSRKLLSESVRRNGFAHVEVLEAAAWSSDRLVELHVEAGANRGAHSLVRTTHGDSRLVPGRRLDTLLTECGISEVDLLKIDAEAAEPDVIEGARRLLEGRAVRDIIVEWNPEAWTSREDLLDWMLERYDAFPYDGNLPFRKLHSSGLRPLPARGGLYLRRRDDPNAPRSPRWRGLAFASDSRSPSERLASMPLAFLPALASEGDRPDGR
jgi:FkbM family methyltransferase